MVGVPFRLSTPRSTIVKDASLLGQGAHLDNHTAQEPGPMRVQTAYKLTGTEGNLLCVQGIPSTYMLAPYSDVGQYYHCGLCKQRGRSEILSPLLGSYQTLELLHQKLHHNTSHVPSWYSQLLGRQIKQKVLDRP